MATTQEEMSRLMANTVPFWKDPGRRRLYAWLLVALVSSATNGYDGSLMNGVQSLKPYERYFHHPTGAKQGIINAVNPVGSCTALFFAPYTADYLGRKPTIIIGAAIILLAGLIQCFATNISMFIAARYLIGLGTGFTGIGSPLLITELAHPAERGKITALYNTQYYFGAFLGGWITFGTVAIHGNWSWKLPSLLQAAPSVLQLALLWFLPESPRYHMSKGKDDKALATLAKYHANGDAEDALVVWEYAEMKASIAQNEQSGRWSELFATKGNRKRVFIAVSCGVFSQFCGTSLATYYLSDILDNLGYHSASYKNLINAFILMCSMFEAWFWAYMVDRVGRRKLFLIAGIGMTFTMAIWIALTARYTETKQVGYGQGVIAMIFFHNFFYNFAWISLNIAYPLEILSFKIRANGLLMQNIGTQICLFISQYAIPPGVIAGGWRFYFFFEGWIIIQVVTVYFFYIETRGATLEEINRTFDGAEAVENFQNEIGGKEGIEDLRYRGNSIKPGDEHNEGGVTRTEEINENEKTK